jgi:Ca-activated chloride channel family protein
LTDGVQNAGVLAPQKAAELAAEFDVKVYCIGVGSNGVAPMPVRDIFGGTRLVGQPVNIDEETLKQVAAKTGGEYFRAENLEGLADIYASIDKLEKTEVTETRYLRYQEHFEYFVSIGLGLITLATVLQASVFRRLP